MTTSLTAPSPAGEPVARTRPRIALLAAEDPRRRGGPSWTATAYYMAQALQRHCGDVVHLHPVFSPVQHLGRLANWLARDLARHPCDFNSTWLQARDWARLFGRRLEGIDIVFATSQTALFVLLETSIPIVYTADATATLVRDYYPFYAGLARWNVRAAEQIERRALHRASLITYPSEWAAASAREDYGVPAARIQVIPYGANLDQAPSKAVATSPRPRHECRLLFVAAEWHRKGGDIAYSAMRALRDSGVPAELTVVGCEPPRGVVRDHLLVFPNLNKDIPAERDRLSRLFLESHFLLLPTRADCSPRVFCEASAHGIPSIATDTGGVASTVVDGENGFRLPLSAGAEAYASLIGRLYADHAAYQALVLSSRSTFDRQLNWDAWGAGMAECLSALPATRP
jgi:glycosyltransferase involved in cell wall biosynthesis